MKRSSGRYLIPILILILLAVGLLTYRILHREPQVEQETSVTEGLLSQREVLLYFASQDGFSLVTEAREVPEAEEAQLVMEIIQALEAGPHVSLSPILPPGTRLLGYSQQDGVATLDFSKELVVAHPGGSMSELMTVYGLVNTLAVNFPHIRKVRILVEAQPVETLKGHVDLRQPIAADFRFARPSTEDEASTLQENP
jgi:spore germination protein GerM